MPHKNPNSYRDVEGGDSAYQAREATLRRWHGRHDALKTRRRDSSKVWEDLKKDKYGVGPKGPKPTVRILPAEKRPLQVTAAGGQYIIQRGDNLTKIAKRLGTTVDALSKKNNIRNPNIIRAGTKLHYGG